ncbi:hypothetical protein QBC46DRAFT_399813 [Diplogelasinospora grovesii]|uniref:CorA-like Mg2+ transporter protein n=1 Tax=Diplogelasinospora grovesii TaxID=303347 RepID=A0AAN6MVV3_9PEZI|nr:hypothetical protein QBC46DRAFT_399813 [Diplogelasinospora grovesii]
MAERCPSMTERFIGSSAGLMTVHRKKHFDSGTIREEEVVAWLSKQPPTSDDGKPPQAGLRLVCKSQTKIMWCYLDGSILKGIKKVLGLPENHAYLLAPKPGACGIYSATDGQPVFIYHRLDNHRTVSIVFRYDTLSNITTGYVLHGKRVSVGDIIGAIEAQFPSFGHPLLLPTIVVELVAASLFSGLVQIHNELANVEGKTGFSTWANAPDSEMTEGYHQLARQLGSLNCHFAFVNNTVRSMLFMAAFTLKQLELMGEYHASPERYRQVESLGNSRRLKQRVELVESHLRQLETFDAIRDRMQAQQNVLFNLISQQDNSLNIEIAAASKRDSSSMKVIAILTTLFLPATFLSTLFAMPLFDWTAPRISEVTGSYFWLYWAIVAPLTLLVMGFVGAYIWYQSRRNEQADRRARGNAKEKTV